MSTAAEITVSSNSPPTNHKPGERDAHSHCLGLAPSGSDSTFASVVAIGSSFWHRDCPRTTREPGVSRRSRFGAWIFARLWLKFSMTIPMELWLGDESSHQRRLSRHTIAVATLVPTATSKVLGESVATAAATFAQQGLAQILFFSEII